MKQETDNVSMVFKELDKTIQIIGAEKLIEILKPVTEHLNKPEIKKLKEEMDKLIITR